MAVSQQGAEAGANEPQAYYTCPMHPAVVSAHTTRVPVIDGHTLTVSVALEQAPDVAAILTRSIELW